MSDKLRIYVAVAIVILTALGVGARRLLDQTGVMEAERVTVRLAHWFLHEGIDEALEKIAQNYERAHPDVDIEIIAIPERAWAAWQRTQLIGETAPDLMQLRTTQMDELLAQYYIPISEEVEKVNPYNQGTKLEGLPWRETFVDGLSGKRSYNQSLAEFYGVPITVVSLRMYYNEELMEEITGTREPPRTWAEFDALLRQTDAWGHAQGRPLVPIAGSKYNTPRFLYYLFSNQTQKLAQDIDWSRTMTPATELVAQAYLRDGWNMDTPAIQSGIKLMNSAAGFLSEDYLTADRQDATFRFTQGRALMILSSVFDLVGMESEASFEVGAFTVPHPVPGDPTYGQFAMGLSSEASQDADGVFGLTRFSEHPDVAVDFLRFLTSQPSSELFVRETKWLPMVAEVEPHPEAKVFEPRINGFPDGFQLAFAGFGRQLTRNLYDSCIHLMDGTAAGVDAFTAAFEAGLESALRSDIRQQIHYAKLSIVRGDFIMEALANQQAEGPASVMRTQRLSESGVLQMLSYYQNQTIVNTTEKNQHGGNSN